MSLSLAIVVIALADAALIGLLTFVMSRANRLTPHTPVRDTARAQLPASQVAHTAHPSRASRHNTA